MNAINTKTENIPPRIQKQKQKHCIAPCNPPCDRKVISKNYCSGHYQRDRNGGDISTQIQRHGSKESRKGKKCLIPGCQKYYRSGKYCLTHTMQMSNNYCKAPCNPPCRGKIIAKNCCWGHYQKHRKGMDISTPIRRYESKESKKGKKCWIEGCKNPYQRNGHCSLHNNRKANGTPMDAPPTLSKAEQGCLIATCDLPHSGKGFCKFHLRRFERGSDLHAPKKIKDSKQGCKIEDCEKKHYAKGFCCKHYDTDRKIRIKLGIPMEKKRRRPICCISACKNLSRSKWEKFCVDHLPDCNTSPLLTHPLTFPRGIYDEQTGKIHSHNQLYTESSGQTPRGKRNQK